MLNQIKKLSISSLIKSRLFQNMSWLFILNFSNTIIPFFTFPYIARVFLPEGYGMLSFSLAFIAYFQTFINYGFDLTGARKIAMVEGDENKLSKIYTSIILTKFLFFLLSVPIIILVTLMNTRLYEGRMIIFVLIILALSNVIMPNWLFQGLQRVKDMTIVSLIVRIIFMICVFTLIKSPKDIPLYALLYSLSFLIIGIVSIIIINKSIKIKFSRVTFADIRDMIKDGYYVFTSSAVISIMGNTGIFVLGLFHAAEYSGYYSGISKINIVITTLFYPIGQALFPYHSKKYALSFEAGYSSAIKIAKIIIAIFVILALVVIGFRDFIVSLVLGQGFVHVSNLLLVMAFLPVLSIASNFMGTQILVASGYTQRYSRAFLRGAVLSIVLFLGLGYFFATWGVAIGALLGSVANLIFLYIEIRGINKEYKETIKDNIKPVKL